MIPDDREWFRAPGATEQQLAALRAVAPPGTSDGLYKLLGFSNGGEGPLPAPPGCFVLDDADTIADFIRKRPYGSALDGLLVFGGDGGGEFIALDLRRQAPWPVVAMDMVAGPESARQIAADFGQFVLLIGRS
jgi:hypothetical protein